MIAVSSANVVAVVSRVVGQSEYEGSVHAGFLEERLGILDFDLCVCCLV